VASLQKVSYAGIYGRSYLASMIGMSPQANEMPAGNERGTPITSFLLRFSHTVLTRKRYQELKDEWCGVPEVFDSPSVLEVTISAVIM
jgi:hypothetical protein